MLTIHLLLLVLLSTSARAKVTYFNLENTYGPYCNPQSVFTPDAGVVRYAGTPWTGRCELNLQSCCLPMLNSTSFMSNVSISTRFYIYVNKPPLCLSENVTVESASGELTTIDCNTTVGSEFFFDTERLKIVFHRTAKFPMSKFSMTVTPLKIKTRMYTSCGFDCFTDTHCIDRSLICDRYRNCPNNADEANCEYTNQKSTLSTQAKILLFIVLVTIISFDVCSILICYFCCGISNRNHLGMDGKERNKADQSMIEEEGGATSVPLLRPVPSKDNQ